MRAIAALGGVGKTTLARQYLEKFWRCYSLLAADGQSIACHTLVQTVERLQLDDSSGAQPATLKRSLDWINKAFAGDPQDVRSWPTFDSLSSHVASITEYAIGRASPIRRRA